MPTTFGVFFLGNSADIDPTEGNTNAENAANIVGSTFGSSTDPLAANVQTLSPPRLTRQRLHMLMGRQEL